MGWFEWAGLIGEALPVKGQGPRQGEDIDGKDANGVECLAVVPVREGGGSRLGVEEVPGGFRRAVAAGFGPRFGPADVVFVGGLLDRNVRKTLEEELPGGRPAGQRTGGPGGGSLAEECVAEEGLLGGFIPVAEAGLPVPHHPGQAALFGGLAEVADVAGAAGGIGFLITAELADVDG